MAGKFKIDKDVVAKIVESGRTEFLWEQGYDLDKVSQRLEYRGFVGESIWDDEALELVLRPFRDHARKEEITEADIDKSLLSLANKIAVDINRLRFLFYTPEFERWKMALSVLPEEEPTKETKETKKKPPEKIQPTPEAKESSPSEEGIELNVEEEGKEKDEWEDDL